MNLPPETIVFIIVLAASSITAANETKWPESINDVNQNWMLQRRSRCNSYNCQWGQCVHDGRFGQRCECYKCNNVTMSQVCSFENKTYTSRCHLERERCLCKAQKKHPFQCGKIYIKYYGMCKSVCPNADYEVETGIPCYQGHRMRRYNSFFNCSKHCATYHLNGICRNEMRKNGHMHKFCLCCKPSTNGNQCTVPPTTQCPTTVTTQEVPEPCRLMIAAGDASKMFDEHTASNCSDTSCSLPPDHKGNIRTDNTCNEDTIRIRYNGGASCMFYETIGDGDNDNAVRGDEQGVKLNCSSTGGVLSGTLGINGGAGKIQVNDIIEIMCDNVPAGNVGPGC